MIPSDLYEAADLDGANSIQKIMHITFPAVKPTTITLIFITTVSAIKTFPLVYVLTGGGPARTTNFFAITIYEEFFILRHAGTSTALATILFIIALTIAVLQLGLFRRRTEK